MDTRHHSDRPGEETASCSQENAVHKARVTPLDTVIWTSQSQMVAKDLTPMTGQMGISHRAVTSKRQRKRTDIPPLPEGDRLEQFDCHVT